MSEEFEDIGTRIPDFNTAIMQRIQAKKAESTSLPPPGTVDPYQMMLQRKRQGEAGDIDPGKIVRWPEEDVKALQDYCAKMGIYGYSTRQHPKIALMQLKKEFGDDYSNVPLEERVPAGYEKIGTVSPYNQNYPYSEAMRKKQILHG